MEETEKYIDKIKKEFSFKYVDNQIKNLKKLNVLTIGDTIIDQYIFVSPKGRAVKDPIISAQYEHGESYAGGILAIARHISDFVKKIKVVTLIGDEKVNDQYFELENIINKAIELKTFIKKNSPTIVKKRYIDFYRNNKLFKVEYMNDSPISKNLTDKIVNYLNEELPKYDLVVVGDFGHGFINKDIRKKLEEKSRFLALNVQTNSANLGYNYFNLYKNPNFISMNEQEIRLPLCKRFEEIEEIVKETYHLFKYENFLVSLGKRGSIFVNKGKIFRAPVLVSTVKDTVGAGDALFALASLFVYSKKDPKLIPFIANCAGGLAANIVGNKENITKNKLRKFIGNILK